MGAWGCPLCRLAAKAEATYLDSLNYERVMDFNTWDALQASRGLCERHSRAWEKLNGCALGLAMVNRVVLLNLQRATEPDAPKGKLKDRLFRRGGGPATLADALEPTGDCPACTLAVQTAERFADVLLKDIREPEAQALLQACGGLCLPHLRMTLRRPGAPRGEAALIAAHRAVWAALMAELEEFIRKNDYRFQDEKVTEGEGTSWRRALDISVGLKR